MRRLRLVFLGLVLGATVLASGAVGTARAGLTCPGQTYVQPFEPWLDEANYVLMSNGSLESGSGWALNGGAALVDGNEPFQVNSQFQGNSQLDTHSLSLPTGSSVTSPQLCVTLLHPDLRFFAVNSGSPTALLKVDAIAHLGWLGLSVPVATLSSGSVWAPTVPIPFLTNLVSPLFGTVSFRFTPIGTASGWQIDDVYVDPFKDT
jgi:hypothetical protein